MALSSSMVSPGSVRAGSAWMIPAVAFDDVLNPRCGLDDSATLA